MTLTHEVQQRLDTAFAVVQAHPKHDLPLLIQALITKVLGSESAPIKVGLALEHLDPVQQS